VEYNRRRYSSAPMALCSASASFSMSTILRSTLFTRPIIILTFLTHAAAVQRASSPFEARIVGGDTFSLHEFRPKRVKPSAALSLETYLSLSMKRIIPLFIFGACALRGGVKGGRYFPFRNRSVAIGASVEIAWWHHQIPAHKRERGCVAEVHSTNSDRPWANVTSEPTQG